MKSEEVMKIFARGKNQPKSMRKRDPRTMKNTIYQLDSVTNVQMNSYVITTTDGTLLVIDGGHRRDADNLLAHLRTITGQERPHIDAWILSHAHWDHISCFNEIMEHHGQEVTVDRVMYNFPSLQYCAREAGSHGDSRAVEDFVRNLPLFADRVVTLYGFDAYDIGEAHIDVLYSPNAEIQTNYINNSSVIFKLTLGGKKILFLGDAGVEEGDRCLALYAGTDQLRADYVQMAHHGQAGVDKRFYEAVAPTVCLWCTPDWLWNNDAGNGYNTHSWKTVEVRGWMEELGVKEHYVMKDGVHKIELPDSTAEKGTNDQ